VDQETVQPLFQHPAPGNWMALSGVTGRKTRRISSISWEKKTQSRNGRDGKIFFLKKNAKCGTAVPYDKDKEGRQAKKEKKGSSEKKRKNLLYYDLVFHIRDR
jgi:hypothetical protein